MTETWWPAKGTAGRSGYPRVPSGYQSEIFLRRGREGLQEGRQPLYRKREEPPRTACPRRLSTECGSRFSPSKETGIAESVVGEGSIAAVAGAAIVAEVIAVAATGSTAYVAASIIAYATAAAMVTTAGVVVSRAAASARVITRAVVFANAIAIGVVTALPASSSWPSP